MFNVPLPQEFILSALHIFHESSPSGLACRSVSLGLSELPSLLMGYGTQEVD